MPTAYDRVLKGGAVDDQQGEGVRDVGIRGDAIAFVGEIDPGAAGEVIDCTGLSTCCPASSTAR